MIVEDWGRLAYRPAWDRQVEVHARVADGSEDTLVLVEHDSVVTLGANFHPQNLRLAEAEYARRGIEVVQNDRGGDVTYHGPGQLVVYPIFDLRRHGRDVHKWLRDLEETMLVTCRQFDSVFPRPSGEERPGVRRRLQPRRFPPHTGVWVGDRKVAAIGVKVRRWTSLHGIALNCLPQDECFATIVPCGIQGYDVTSLSQETGRQVGLDEAKPIVIEAFEQVFGVSSSMSAEHRSESVG